MPILPLEPEDELVQQGGADRVEPGRRLVKENDFRGPRQRAHSPFAHAAADFDGTIISNPHTMSEEPHPGTQTQNQHQSCN